MLQPFKQKYNHALKIEDLDLTEAKANSIVEVLKNFLVELGYSEERIGTLECRSRDGFSPYSHNKGGVEGIAFMMQDTSEQYLYQFPNALKTVQKYAKYSEEMFRKENNIPKDTELTEDQQEELWQWLGNDTESTILFSVDLMLTSENQLNVRACVCAKDAPYHRHFDDKIEKNIKFKTVTELKSKLKALLKTKKFDAFSDALSEAY